MLPSRKRLLLLLFVFVFIAFGEAISPIEAQEELASFESPKAYTEGQQNLKKVMYITVTGYSSSYDETDDDPWVTAQGTQTRFGIAASNDLPFGTRIRIPSLFGDQVFTIEDRMNRRYSGTGRIDVWLPSKLDAVFFGIHRKTLVEVLN